MFGFVKACLALITITVFSQIATSSADSLDIYDFRHSLPVSTRTAHPANNSTFAETVLTSGQTRMIMSNDTIQSPNRAVKLKFDSNGDLTIVKTCDPSSVIWKQVVTGNGKKITMETNGNFVVQGTRKDSLADDMNNWDTNTASSPGAILTLQDDGYLCVSYQNECIWSNNKHADARCFTYKSARSPTPSEIIAARTVLTSDQQLTTNVVSENGSVGLRIMQTDAPPVSVFRTCDERTLWIPQVTKTTLLNTALLTMQRDGNLVLYTSDKDRQKERNAYWATGTEHQPGAELKLFDDGLLCVAKNEECIWSSQTHLYSTDCSVNNPFNKNAINDELTTPSPVNDSSTVLLSGQRLKFSQAVTFSPSGAVGLRVKTDTGKPTLAVFRTCDGDVLWNPRFTQQTDEPVELIMQRDGRLVLYGVDDHQVYWSSSSTRIPGTVLKLYDNGRMCTYIYGECVWSTESRFPSRSVECYSKNNSSRGPAK